MEIQCGSCVLRPFTLDDADALAVNANDRDIWLNLRDRFPHPYSLENARTFLTAYTSNPSPTGLGIVVDGEAAGMIGLDPGHDVERVSAEVGYWLGRKFWGRGVMTDALRAFTSHAFRQHEFTRIFALPFSRNTASRRVLEKAGYLLEGVLHNSAMKDGKLLDQHLYAAYRS
jgi:RimJ/RimL family protein N-acetyltransferase